MRQVLQNRKTGKTVVVDVPVPVLQRGRVLVRTVASLISAGTERAAVETVKKTLVQEARERPDLVRAVIDKARHEGLRKTIDSVRDKLHSSQALGYSAAGIVQEVGADVAAFKPGDRVACAGLGFASHAEVLSVPKNLCVRLPENVDFEGGAFGTMGAIALQGVRLSAPTLGEAMVVIGLGLLGQLTVQLLKANGCRVFGIDLDSSRVELARQLGAEATSVSGSSNTDEVLSWTRGRGADGVLVTTATESNQPIEQAGQISRLRGRVVVVGTTGLQIPRESFYARELSLKVSRSYGPGRYDAEYEEQGKDYPFAYVRWTEQRNIEAFLDLLSEGTLKVTPLISHRFEIQEAERAYELLSGETNEKCLAVLLSYDSQREPERTIQLAKPHRKPGDHDQVRVGLIGAGDYARAVLLPQLKAAGAQFGSIASASGVSALDVGKKFEFAQAVSSADDVINDNSVNLIVVATRHDSHAELAVKALEENKHVLVEKPLALDAESLDQVISAAAGSSGQLMVGFNRRFSPLARKAQDLFAARSTPLSILYRVSAGQLPVGHWVQDPIQGGGRIIGEICHFIDLMQFWVGGPLVSIQAGALGANSEAVTHDSVLLNLGFADGSAGCLIYVCDGDKALPKERAEIFGEGKTFVIDDFRAASMFQNGKEERIVLRTQDKGQKDEIRAVCEVVLDGSPWPVTLGELAATTRATFRAVESLRTGQRRVIDE